MASMPIYLCHMLCVTGTRMILLKALHITNFPLHLAAGVTVGLLAPVVFFYFTYRFDKERWFGFSGGELAFRGFGIRPGGVTAK